MFLDIERPLRRPLSWINDGIIRAVSRSPFVKSARAQHVAREKQLTAAWNATAGAAAASCPTEG